MNSRRCTIGVTLAAGALLAGCTTNAQPTQTPIPTAVATTSAPATPTASMGASPSPSEVEWFPDTPTTESPVQAEIRSAWEAYETTMDKFARDPELNDLTEIQYVTTGQEATDAVQVIVRLRENNLMRKGNVTFRDAVIAEPVTNTDGVTTSEVNYCFDPAHLQTLDIDTGQPGENAIRPDQTMKVTVVMEQMPDGSWRAALSETELALC